MQHVGHKCLIKRGEVVTTDSHTCGSVLTRSQKMQVVFIACVITNPVNHLCSLIQQQMCNNKPTYSYNEQDYSHSFG